MKQILAYFTFVTLFALPRTSYALRYEFEGLPEFSIYNTVFTPHENNFSNNKVGDSGYFKLSFDENGQNVEVDALLFKEPPLPFNPTFDYTSLRFDFNIPTLFSGLNGFSIDEATGEFRLGPCCGSDTPESYLEFSDAPIAHIDQFSLSTDDPQPILGGFIENGSLQLNFHWFIGTTGNTIFEIGDLATTPIRYLGKTEVSEPCTVVLLILGITALFYRRANLERPDF